MLLESKKKKKKIKNFFYNNLAIYELCILNTYNIFTHMYRNSTNHRIIVKVLGTKKKENYYAELYVSPHNGVENYFLVKIIFFFVDYGG